MIETILTLGALVLFLGYLLFQDRRRPGIEKRRLGAADFRRMAGVGSISTLVTLGALLLFPPGLETMYLGAAACLGAAMLIVTCILPFALDSKKATGILLGLAAGLSAGFFVWLFVAERLPRP